MVDAVKEIENAKQRRAKVLHPGEYAEWGERWEMSNKAALNASPPQPWENVL